MFRIYDGPDKKDLWMRTPRIDSFQAAKEITQLPVEFLVEVEARKARIPVYLDNISRIENDPDGVLFTGTCIEPVSGISVIVEGQYDFMKRTGFMEIRDTME